MAEPHRIHFGNLWRRLVLPKRIDSWSLTSLQQRLVKTGGRLVKHARYYGLLLAESHLAAPVWKHGAADGGPAGTVRIACDGGGANRARGEGAERFLRSRLKLGTSGFLCTRRSQRWPLPGPLKSLGMKIMGKAAPMEAVGFIVDCGQEAKTENLVKC